ncbi:DUF4406 domain-containing protein [Methylomonas sp. 11b]|uniref:DUF4406 domain-containing protein n=1 Tax=Methylomonas sp. 11b TaxID=1168169 RepID=UPI00047D2C06|nr:DUF4406 domain-containing protein [Methylomonas sp. 11b]
MIKLFLAGPMSGIANYNYPAFHSYAQKLRNKGYHVENPADSPPPKCVTWLGYQRNAIRQMLTCQTVAFLPNWQRSKGASEQYVLASKLEIPCFYAADLIEHGSAALQIKRQTRCATAGGITLNGKEFSAADLLNRIMMNMKHPPKGRASITRWAMVSHLTGLGSNTASELCLHFGKNPDDVLR